MDKETRDTIKTWFVYMGFWLLMLLMICLMIFVMSYKANAQNKSQLSYTIIGATKANDGSITANVYFNIYGSASLQNVNFAPATSLSDIQVGLTNFATMLYKRQLDSIVSIQTYNSILLQTDTTVLNQK